MSKPGLKCRNSEAIFKQNYTLKVVIAFKWPILAFLAKGKSRF